LSRLIYHDIVTNRGYLNTPER